MSETAENEVRDRAAKQVLAAYAWLTSDACLSYSRYQKGMVGDSADQLFDGFKYALEGDPQFTRMPDSPIPGSQDVVEWVTLGPCRLSFIRQRRDHAELDEPSCLEFSMELRHQKLRRLWVRESEGGASRECSYHADKEVFTSKVWPTAAPPPPASSTNQRVFEGAGAAKCVEKICTALIAHIPNGPQCAAAAADQAAPAV